MKQSQRQLRYVTRCQVCNEVLPRRVQQININALVTCSKTSCKEFALACWLKRPSGVMPDK